jgi:hypothetical protein
MCHLSLVALLFFFHFAFHISHFAFENTRPASWAAKCARAAPFAVHSALHIPHSALENAPSKLGG